MKKTFIKLIGIIGIIVFVFLAQATEYPVGITKSMAIADVFHQGIAVTIKRVQDPSNRIADDFAKTSRKCPPFCIHPMQAAPDVKTVGELELINFVQKDVQKGTGILIDARMPKFFQSETIPGAVNIPFILFDSPNKEELLLLLGVKKDNGKLDFSTAKDLLVFCNGPWCDQSPRAINALLKEGYPASKLLYYRGGMQLWKIFSLTTVTPKANIVGK